MSTKPDFDGTDEAGVREMAYAHGRALLDVKPSESLAHQRAGTYERHYPASEHGLTFTHRLHQRSNTTIMLDDDGNPVEAVSPDLWGVYAEPAPYLADRQAWTEDLVRGLVDRLQAWGGPVLVRTFRTSGSTRTTTHRDNTKTKAAWEPLLDGVEFRTRRIGIGSGFVHGEFAVQGGSEDA